MRAAVGVLAACAIGAVAASWHPVPEVAKPVARSGMSGAVVGGDLVVFGGCSSSCCYAPLDDTWALASGKWAEVVTGPIKPTPRVYHTAVQDPARDSYLVYGGTAVSAGFLSDLWRLTRSSTEQGVWEQVNVTGSSVPPPRAGHSAVVVGSSMVVFGGRNSLALLQDVWVLDLPTLSWTEQRSPATCSTVTCPSVRTNHAAAVTSVGGRPFMVVHGGSDIHGNDLSDVWALDLASFGWSKLAVANTAPLPAPRHGHSLWPSHNTTGLSMFGGKSGTADSDPFLGGTWGLQLGSAALRLGGPTTAMWTLLANASYTPSGNTPQARAYAAVGSIGEQQVLFGGFSGYAGGLNDKLHNDLWSF